MQNRQFHQVSTTEYDQKQRLQTHLCKFKFSNKFPSKVHQDTSTYIILEVAHSSWLILNLKLFNYIFNNYNDVRHKVLHLIAVAHMLVFICDTLTVYTSNYLDMDLAHH